VDACVERVVVKLLLAINYNIFTPTWFQRQVVNASLHFEVAGQREFSTCGRAAAVSSQTNRRQRKHHHKIIIIIKLASCSSVPSSALGDGTLHWRVVMSSFLNFCCWCWCWCWWCWSHKREVESSHLSWQAVNYYQRTGGRAVTSIWAPHIPAGYHPGSYPHALSQWWGGCFICFYWPCLPTKARILLLVFRFIIEYSSLKGFWPLGSSRSIFIWGFLEDDILACVETWD